MGCGCRKPFKSLLVMKKLILTFTAALMVGFFPVLAEGTEENANYSFNSVDQEVAMGVERGSGEVKLQILVKDLSQYDHIIIERSAETPNYFGKCKYISCADIKSTDGKFLQLDKYPYSASKDVYYRIKTVTKDGIERAYPAVLLSAITQ